MHIPNLAEAIAAENANRDEAFVGLGEVIYGELEVLQMTPKHLLILDGCGNAFVTGKEPEATDIAVFLWVLSPEFTIDSKKRDTFLAKIKELPVKPLLDGIKQYLEKTFQDAPTGAGGNGKPYASWVAILIDAFAAEYGWTPEIVVNIPLRQLYQLIDAKNKRKYGNDYIKINKSDRIISDWLRELNEKATTKS